MTHSLHQLGAGQVFRNEWRNACVALSPEWTPTRSVSIIIPAHQSHATLPLTLAALAAQDYPAELMEVIVVDDGSEPALELPKICPTNTRILTPPHGWGRANAVHHAVLQSDGDIIMQLDADIVVRKNHVTAHLHWHDSLTNVATKGTMVYVDRWPDDPADIFKAAQSDNLDPLFSEAKQTPHWTETTFRKTDDLNSADGRVFSILTGPSSTMSRELYMRAGGMRTDLRLGEDTELAYRVAQAGGVFVPCREANTWHLGESNITLDSTDVDDYNTPFFAQDIPLLRHLRTSTGRRWSVPLIRVAVEFDESSAGMVRGCADRILSSVTEDLHLDIVGPWQLAEYARTEVLSDELRDLRATAEWYRGDGRVRLLDERAPTVFPAPFELSIPVEVGVKKNTITRLMKAIQAENLGVVTAEVEFSGLTAQVQLMRTAAVERAEVYWPDQPAHLGAAAVWGSHDFDSAAFTFTDLRDPAARHAQVRWRRDPDDARQLRTEITTQRLGGVNKAHRRRARRIARRLRRVLNLGD